MKLAPSYVEHNSKKKDNKPWISEGLVNAYKEKNALYKTFSEKRTE